MTLPRREALVQDALAKGLTYVADTDGRNIGTANPLGSVWDNGPDPVTSLNEVLEVRRLALDKFGLRNIHPGQPVSDLNKVMVPIYLYHRYQTAAAGKLIGGMSFNYGLKNDGQPSAEIVTAERQREALKAVLQTIEPETLDLKDDILALLGPSLTSYSFADSDRELFDRTAYPAFDVSTAADTAAAMTFEILLDPRRVARLVEFNRRDSSQLGFTELMRTIEAFVMKPAGRGRTAEIAKVIQARYVFSLMDLGNSDVSPGIKARIDAELRRLQSALSASGSGHGKWLVTRIEEHLNKPAPAKAEVTESKPLPPGGPIGMGDLETCWHCE